MSYQRTAGAVDDAIAWGKGKVEQYAGRAGSVLEAGKLILEDPALPQVAGLIVEMNKLEQAKPRPGVPVARTAGIGLRKAIGPMRAYVAARKNPIIGVAVLAVLIGLPVFIGYQLGRRK